VAERLYNSPLFKGARDYGKARCDTWFILSAKHGLVDPSEIIAPYDESLVGMPPTERRKWSQEIFSRLVENTSSTDRIILLAGKPYREFLVPLLQARGNEVAAPLSGLGIGSQAGWLLKLTTEHERLRDLDRLYELLRRLGDHLGGPRVLASCTGKNDWPGKGIYLFFEPNEMRMSAPFDFRLVRIGTHSVSSGSKTTLWNRLRTHRGGETDGSGNHRGSIFRLHVGEALIKSRGLEDDFSTWGKGQSASSAIRKTEANLERLVSNYLGQMSLLWLAIEDPAGPASDRAYLERNLIGLVSGPFGPIDLPSRTWLGNYSSKSAITSSGLWNINHVDHSYDPRALDVLEQYVEVSIGAAPKPTGPLAPKDWHKRSQSVLGAKQLSLLEGQE